MARLLQAALRLRPLSIWFFLSLAMFLTALSLVRAAPPPQRPRLAVAANLLPNAVAAGSRGWSLVNGAVYDPRISHAPGSGSLVLPAPSAQVQSAFIPVKPGATYTFSLFMRSNVWPALAVALVGVYDAGGKFKYNWKGSYQATTEANVWQECVITYRPQPGDAKVRVVFGRLERGRSPRDDGAIWADDFYFGEGLHFRLPYTAKKPFDGKSVRVDALGNFEVFRRGSWQPFFPFGIYQNPSKPSYESYSQQGFNCTMFNELGIDHVKRAQKAVSRFNPDGMMTMMEIGQFIDPKSKFFKQFPLLREGLAKLREAGVEEGILAYYWDNEEYDKYAEVVQMIDIVRAQDADKQGQRQRPIFMLQGNQGMTRVYHGLVDVAGDYLRNELTNAYIDPQLPTEDRIAVLNNVEGQSIPVSIGIISEEETAAGVRRLVYEHLIAGGRGFAYYRDGAFFQFNGDKKSPAAKDISLRQCWAEFPRLRAEIDRALQILRESHRTTWKARSSKPSIHCGMRTYKGEGYLVVLNTNREATPSTFLLEGLPYAPTEVKDYFTDRVVAPVKGNQFQITLSGEGTAILRLCR